MKILKAEFIKSCGLLEDCPREGVPEIALVGRSNVGKSSLLNKMMNRKVLAKISRTPGKTRLLNYFEVLLAPLSKQPFYLVDLPGYGYAKASADQQATWGRLVERYLKEQSALKELVLLLDIRRAPSTQDLQLLSWAENYQLPVLMVATKLDKISRGGRRAALQSLKRMLPPSTSAQEILPVSSLTGEGCEALLQAIVRRLT